MQDGAVAATEGGRRQGAVAAGLVLAGAALLVATRAWHPIAGLGNADIAGIFYEADLLRAGGVPYVDTIDMKPPGTFFVIAGVFSAFGRSIAAVHLAYLGWCLLAAPAIWIAARALYGRATTAGWAVLLYLGEIGVFDFNYSAWMATAYAWAFACLIAAIRDGRVGLHLAAGTCAALAMALKGHAVVLEPTFALVWWWGRRRGEPGARAVAWPLWLAGAGLGVLPLAGWYAAQGARQRLVSGPWGHHALVSPLGVAAVVEAIGVSLSLLAQDATSRRHGVPFSKAGRMVWYVRSELDAWTAAHKVTGKEAA